MHLSSQNCSPKKKIKWTLINKQPVSKEFNRKGKGGGMRMMKNHATPFFQRQRCNSIYWDYTIKVYMPLGVKDRRMRW